MMVVMHDMSNEIAKVTWAHFLFFYYYKEMGVGGLMR